MLENIFIRPKKHYWYNFNVFKILWASVQFRKYVFKVIGWQLASNVLPKPFRNPIHTYCSPTGGIAKCRSTELLSATTIYSQRWKRTTFLFHKPWNSHVMPVYRSRLLATTARQVWPQATLHLKSIMREQRQITETIHAIQRTAICPLSTPCSPGGGRVAPARNVGSRGPRTQ